MSDPLLFSLSKPIQIVLSGAHGPRREEEIASVTMRRLDTKDLPLLDRFRGQPGSLAINVAATLSGLTLAQVRKIALDDFTPIGAFALAEVAAAARCLGLPADAFFLLYPPDEQ